MSPISRSLDGHPHAGGKPPEMKCRILVTYIVDKSEPLATPV
jgi:hypothetical protein